MRTIVFIEAKSPGAHIFSRTALPRLGSILLATILKNLGYSTRVFIEDIHPVEWKTVEEADFVCISSISSTAQRAFQIAEKLKKLNIPAAIGGPHSTFLPEESLQYADYVIRGEGEETLPELLNALIHNLPLETINGLSYKTPGGEIRNTPDRELIPNLDDGPIPDFNLVHRWDKSHVIPIATSRGCPYACKFCSVIPMFGRKYRFKSINRVLQEVEASARKKSHVFFIDDNFAANKERTKELLREMIARKIKIEWSAQVRTEVANDTELIELMKKSGCFAVFIGFESINPMTLSLYNKSQNLGDIEKAIKTLKKYSINIHGMFVLGSDTDDIATIKNTAKFAKKLDIESVQFMVLTPLPGTPVFQEMKDSGRLIHTNWSAYDAHHAVFEPKLMTAFELHIETLKAMAKFYSWKTILKNLWRFDFFYAVVGIYGKRSVRKALSNAREYLEDLKNQLSTDFDKRTLKLRQKFLQQKGKTKEVILNTTSMQITEYQFFSTFLSKLDKKIIINKKDFDVTEGILAITPLVEHLKNRHEMGKQQLTDFYDKYRDRLESVEIVNMGSISLYKSCVNIGQLLGIKTKKIRKAYEQALKSIDGTPFECNNILILLSR